MRWQWQKPATLRQCCAVQHTWLGDAVDADVGHLMRPFVRCIVGRGPEGEEGEGEGEEEEEGGEGEQSIAKKTKNGDKNKNETGVRTKRVSSVCSFFWPRI